MTDETGIEDHWKLPNPWHKLHPDEYEAAVAEGAGTLAGTCSARGEDGPYWTDPFHAGFRAAIGCAFDRGFAASRAEEHDCQALAAAEARGEARGRRWAVQALRDEAFRVLQDSPRESAAYEHARAFLVAACQPTEEAP